MSISVRASSAAPGTEARPQRILLPFPDRSLPQRALDTALRMARTENATLVPVRLERIPLHLPMDASPGRQVAEALAGIQRRARELGVPVDPRIGHGRSYRHALLLTLTTERYDRVVLATGQKAGSNSPPPMSPGWSTTPMERSWSWQRSAQGAPEGVRSLIRRSTIGRSN
jgi:hypothetical protein